MAYDPALDRGRDGARAHADTTEGHALPAAPVQP